MVQMNINYVASAFLLLEIDDCFRAWKRMWFYSHILAIGSIIFFRAGGSRALKRNLPNQHRGSVPSVKVHPPSPIDSRQPPHDDSDHTDLRWIKHDLDSRSRGDESVEAEANLADKLVRGQETPRSEYGGSSLSRQNSR
jgi:lysophospholipid acyltransferase